MFERPLSSLRPGERTTVVRVLGEDAVSCRLRDLGFWPGTAVEKVRVAPFGDPAEYSLRGYHIALRRAEADKVVTSSISVVP